MGLVLPGIWLIQKGACVQDCTEWPEGRRSLIWLHHTRYFVTVLLAVLIEAPNVHLNTACTLWCKQDWTIASFTLFCFEEQNKQTWRLEVWKYEMASAISFWFSSDQTLDCSRNICLFGLTLHQSTGIKEINVKWKWQTCSSSLWDTNLQPGMVETPLHSHIKEQRKKSLHLVQSHGCLAFLWICVCVCLCVCARICLDVCMSYLWVHLRRWAAGYAALKGCVSAATSLSLSLFFSLTLFLLLFCLRVCIIHRLCSVHCTPLLMLYRDCFQRTRQNVAGASRSRPFKFSTGTDLMLFEWEAG